MQNIIGHSSTRPLSVPRILLCWSEREARQQMLKEAAVGLTASPKELSPKWFYDARGSQLFERITQLPEYYPTRTELRLLKAHANDIVRRTRADTLIELGSGTSEKTLTLLDAFTKDGQLRGFVPQDVCQPYLTEAAIRVAARYPSIDVTGVVGDFERHLSMLPSEGHRLVAFLGSTIGNLKPDARAQFFETLSKTLNAGEWLLLGADLIKDRLLLHAAYNDSRGVTAEFNLNVLNVLNRELHASFIPDHFRHRARWNEEHSWMEMLLESTHKQSVALGELGLNVYFSEGELLRTEVSTKFRQETLESELAAANFGLREWWTDPQGHFALLLAERLA